MGLAFLGFQIFETIQNLILNDLLPLKQSKPVFQNFFLLHIWNLKYVRKMKISPLQFCKEKEYSILHHLKFAKFEERSNLFLNVILRCLVIQKTIRNSFLVWWAYKKNWEKVNEKINVFKIFKIIEFYKNKDNIFFIKLKKNIFW